MIGRMFDSMGGAPLAVQVDPTGELNSLSSTRLLDQSEQLNSVAESYFTHRESRMDVTQASEQWRNGRPERRHSLVKRCTRCTLAHANAPLEFWFLCLSHVVLTLNLLLRSRDSDTKELKEMTIWEEEVDYLELSDILIMGKEFGDKDEHKGLTRSFAQ